MALRIHVSFQGVEKHQDFSADKVLIGRPDGSGAPSLDLSPDACVSRQHAQVELKFGVCWLTDLGSKFGTRVNGREISAQGEWRLEPTDVVVIGETRLRVTILGNPKPPVAKAVQPASAKPAAAISAVTSAHPEPVPSAAAIIIPAPAHPPRPSAAPAHEPKIVHMIDTSKPLAFAQSKSSSTSDRRLALLLDLPRQFSAREGLGDLFQTIMTRVVEVIPAARRGALLLRDAHQEDTLLLKAYVSASEPAVSETLARRAMNEKRGILWRSGHSEDPSRSIREFNIVSGLYAPLQWHDRVFGVICVDSPNLTDAFREEDLQFLVAIGQYAGMALAERDLLDEFGRKAKVVDRLLANFSPKVRSVLLDHAKHGKLRPGGEKSELTILFCDICNFTRSSAQMDAHDVVEMLNHYFQPLIEAVFKHDGTVDKFVGDAILAIFGGPEPDIHHPQKAVAAALAIQEAVRVTSQQRAARGDVTCQVRIGVHSGEVFHGFIGALDRLEYTVIGDAVNRANRYCEAASEGQILISPEVFQRVFNLVRAEKTTVATKEGELLAYRLKELKSENRG
jgi:adenylate cyclase